MCIKGVPETPTPTPAPAPNLKQTYHGEESWNTLGEHCAKVYNTSYNTLNEKESYASYETDNKLLISERNVQKTCQVEEGHHHRTNQLISKESI